MGNEGYDENGAVIADYSAYAEFNVGAYSEEVAVQGHHTADAAMGLPALVAQALVETGMDANTQAVFAVLQMEAAGMTPEEIAAAIYEDVASESGDSAGCGADGGGF